MAPMAIPAFAAVVRPSLFCAGTGEDVELCEELEACVVVELCMELCIELDETVEV